MITSQMKSSVNTQRVPTKLPLKLGPYPLYNAVIIFTSFYVETKEITWKPFRSGRHSTFSYFQYKPKRRFTKYQRRVL